MLRGVIVLHLIMLRLTAFAVTYFITRSNMPRQRGLVCRLNRANKFNSDEEVRLAKATMSVRLFFAFFSTSDIAYKHPLRGNKT